MNYKDLEIGDVFYECQSGHNLKMTVKTAPVIKDGQMTWIAQNTLGDEVDYLVTEGLERYGPRLYDSPQYVSIKDGNTVATDMLTNEELELDW